jgi:hypothetical protein
MGDVLQSPELGYRWIMDGSTSCNTKKKIDLVYHGIYHQVGDAEIEMVTLVTEPLLSH